MAYKIIKAIVAGVLKIFFRVRVVGEENLPMNGGCVVCANHVSNWDGVFLIGVLKRQICFMGKDELFHVIGLGAILRSIGVIPVKRNSSDIGAVRTAIKTLNDGKALGIFPSGTRVKAGEKVEVKSGVAFIAIKAGVPVIPIYIDSKYRLFGKATIYVGKGVDMSVYGKAKLSSEELSKISAGLFESINSLAGEDK